LDKKPLKNIVDAMQNQWHSMITALSRVKAINVCIKQDPFETYKGVQVGF